MSETSPQDSPRRSAFVRAIVQVIAGDRPGLLLGASALGVLGGLAMAGSIAIIHQSIRDEAPPAVDRFVLFLGLCLAVPLLRTWSQYLLLRRSLASMMRLVLDLIERVFATPLRRIEEIGPNRILSALTRDVSSLTETISAVPNMLMQGTVVAGCTIYLAWRHPAGAVLFIAVVLIAAGGTLAAVRRGGGILRRARGDADALFECFDAHLSGLKELQLHRPRRNEFLAHVRTTGESFARHHLAGEMVFSGAMSGFQLMFLLPIGILVLLLAPLWQIPRAEVAAYTLLLLYITGPVAALSGLIQTFGRGAVALRHIEELGLALPRVEPATDGRECSSPPSETEAAPGTEAAPKTDAASWRQIELAGVTHAYTGGDGVTPFVLGPLDLRFDRGRVVFITGGNGSGKTTLAKLLCGLYVPDAGVMAVDRQPITDASRDEHRQRFSAVFSDYHLFKRLFGLRAPGLDADIRDRLARLQLTRVDVRDRAFTTIDLSQGQRKRLALLVAQLEGRDIYVFDECAADQDQTFREHFYRQLLPELREAGKTVFVISHDERFFELADRVLTLDLGQVVSDLRPHQRTS